MRDAGAVRNDLETMHERASGWSLIRPEDEALYLRISQQEEPDVESYEGSWAFLTQETRNLGMKRVKNGVLWVAVIRYDASPFVFVFPPVGSRRYCARDVRSIDAQLRALTGRRVVFRKVAGLQFVDIMRLQEAVSLQSDHFTDPRDIPEDVRPQVIIAVDESLAREGTHFMKIRNHLRRFIEDRHPRVELLSPGNSCDVGRLVKRWNDEGRSHFQATPGCPAEPVSANEGAYTIFAERFANQIDGQHLFGRMVYVDWEPVGFAFAGRTSDTGAALYSSLTLTRFRGASEFLITCILEDLQRAGIRHLNLGGAETDKLFRFKSKFHVVSLRPAFDVELQQA
jgi:hypothetical protein